MASVWIAKGAVKPAAASPTSTASGTPSSGELGRRVVREGFGGGRRLRLVRLGGGGLEAGGFGGGSRAAAGPAAPAEWPGSGCGVSHEVLGDGRGPVSFCACLWMGPAPLRPHYRLRRGSPWYLRPNVRHMKVPLTVNDFLRRAELRLRPDASA